MYTEQHHFGAVVRNCDSHKVYEMGWMTTMEDWSEWSFQRLVYVKCSGKDSLLFRHKFQENESEKEKKTEKVKPNRSKWLTKTS